MKNRSPSTSGPWWSAAALAGMTAALGLADQGFEVVLVEKEPELGGMARHLTKTIEGADVQSYLEELIQKAMSHPNLQILTQSLIVGFTGFKGNFTTEVLVGPGMYERKIDHGAVILATGATEYRPKEFGYGEDPRVMTQVELGKFLETEAASKLNQVVMIQCIGSRNDENPNCSRICCQSAIKNALHIKALNPEADVSVLYRDIRTYGLLEDYFTEARKLGILFFRYTPEDMPVVEFTPEGVEVIFTDPIIRRKLQISADLLVLSAGMVAGETEELSSIMKLARNAEGYLPGSPCQAPARGYGHRRYLYLRHGPQSQAAFGNHRAVPGGSLPGNHVPVSGQPDPVRGDGPG